MKLTFLIKGSAPEPYAVTFGRTGNNLTTSCTCPAGKNGQYCKHRFNLMEGDLSALVSKNTGDIAKLHELILGTDVAEAYRPVHEANQAVARIEQVLHYAPPQKTVLTSADAAAEVLRAGGVMKGKDASRQLHVYLLDGTYKGTLKVDNDISSLNVSTLLPGLPLKSTRRKDDQGARGSKSICCFQSGSEFERLLQLEENLSDLKLRLRKAMRD